MITKTATKELSTEVKQIATMQELISKYRPHMTALLGKHISPERMLQLARLAVGRNPKLAQCTAASVIGAVLESCRLGLEPAAGAGETWFLPFKNKYSGRLEVTLIIDYRGLVKLMKENAEVGAILAEAVYDNDKFGYGSRNGELFLDWEPAKIDRKKLIGYVAATWSRTKQLTAVSYLTLEEIEKSHKNRSKAKDSGPWATDPDAMSKKTVIRQVAKLNPYSTANVHRAVALDEQAELGNPQDLALLADPESKASPVEEEKPPFKEPQRASEKKEESEAKQKEVIGKVIRRAKTTIENKEVTVLTISDGKKETKVFTDQAEAVAAVDAFIGKDNQVEFLCDSVDKNLWLVQFRMATKGE